MFLMKTKERNKLSQVTTNTIMDNVSCLVAQYCEILKHNVIRQLNLSEDAAIATVSGVFDVGTNIFEGLTTEALQKAFIKSNFTHVAPVKITLGSVLSRKRKNNEPLICEKEESFVYIPILQTLEQTLGNKKLSNLILKKPFQTNDGYYYDFFDGSLYHNDSFFDQHPNALALMLYHDELEVCNALGSCATKHKIDMYHYCIVNISPKYRSRPCAVQLMAITNASYVKKYGVEKILSPIIDDLLLLYNGFKIYFNDEPLVIHGKVIVSLGDTLGQHLWGGFKEGVGSAYQKCRQCYCNFDSLQSTFDLEKFDKRTYIRYKIECAEIENAPLGETRNELKTTYGINKRSAFCRLPYYNVIKQLPQDIMHVAYEGVVQYELRIVLKELIYVDKCTTLDAINGAISTHQYGYSEISSKPPLIRETVFTGDESYKLKFEADQARLLLKIFPLLLAPIIGVDNDIFKFVVALVGIMKSLSSPVIGKETVKKLKEEIGKHYLEFKRLFPERNMIPKHHYLLHLIESVEELGPPIRYSCFSFEAAHKYFKNLAKSQNFKNLPFSLANRNQYLQTCNFADKTESGSSHPLFQKEKVFGVTKSLNNEENIKLRSDFNDLNLLPGIVFETIYSVSWIVRFGTKYSREAIIAIGADRQSKLPIFGKITKIYVVYDYIYFEISVYSTEEFIHHFQGYHVKPTEQKTLVPYGSLLDYNVFHLKKHIDENNILQPKYSLTDIIEKHLDGSNPLNS